MFVIVGPSSNFQVNVRSSLPGSVEMAVRSEGEFSSVVNGPKDSIVGKTLSITTVVENVANPPSSSVTVRVRLYS